MERTVHYTLFPYNFYRGKKKIAWLSVKDNYIQKLKRKYPEITFKEDRDYPDKSTYVVCDKPISDIPLPNLIGMVAAWAGGNEEIKKVICKTEFDKEIERLNEELKKPTSK